MLHRYRIQPSNLAGMRFTGILATPAKDLAKSLDKGLGVEYRARVLIVTHFERRFSQTRTDS